ncbi:MAG: sugar ABC transporter ATP-binding protein [Rhodospirillales bacterium]
MSDGAMLSVGEISKSFPGVKSLDRVSFAAEAGEVHALLGENGAGKSTLVKIVAGVYQPDGGTLDLDGKRRVWSSPHDAQAAGVYLIHQELLLFPELSVSENILIGQQPRGRFGLIDKTAERRIASELLEALGHPLDPDALLRDLSVADQQMVEIAKALRAEAKVLILDEPTAVLSGRETEVLFERMRSLKAKGVAVIYISHRLEEIFEIADQVTVLKDGQLVDSQPIAALTRDSMIAMMVGREISNLYPPAKAVREGAAEVLRVEEVSLGRNLRQISFSLREGEILGLAGLVGAGRTELAHGLFGALPLSSGRVLLDGDEVTPLTPQKAIDLGIGFLTEDRKAEGLFLEMSLAANVTAPTIAEISNAWGRDGTRERTIALEAMETFSIAAHSPGAKVVGLSGGNQQKVLFGRWVRSCRRVLILDEPTRGVDVGAKSEIYRIIRALADRGIAILMISSELPEVLGMCQRVIVMREGRLTGELAGDALSEEEILRLATLETAAPTARRQTAR